jgi:hypothetical protein
VVKLGQILLQFSLNFGLGIKVNPCWSGTQETSNTWSKLQCSKLTEVPLFKNQNLC